MIPDQTVEPAPDTAIAQEAVRALARLARVLERTSSEISLANYRVLAAIASGDRYASRVGAKLAIGKPTISAAVESLCARGLLRRSAGDGDLRVVDLSLTEAGHQLLARVEGDMIARVVDLCARTSHGKELLAGLASLGPAIDEQLDHRGAAARRRSAT